MHLRSLLTTAACALALAACGSDDETASSGAAEASAPAAESGAFPVKIPHRYGTTVIDAEPERVVIAGLREQDAALALGVVPVAATEWYGKHPGAVFPWAEEALGDADPPAVLTYEDGLQIEKIAAQRPDLIIAVYSGMTKKEYAQLTKLAPVVAQPKGQVDYGSSWQEETLLTGRALGRPARAQELVDETERQIAAAAAEHPEFRGQEAAVVADYQGVFAYGPQDVRSRFLEELGFTYPKALQRAFPDDFGGQISEEKLDLLDVDTLVWFDSGGKTERKMAKNPVYAKLPVHRDARDVFVLEDDRVYEATSFVSVLSMPTLLKEYVPRLAAAVDGDPSTATAQQPAA